MPKPCRTGAADAGRPRPLDQPAARPCRPPAPVGQPGGRPGDAKPFPGDRSRLAGDTPRTSCVELALEGFRYDDLMRWKAGKLLEHEPEGIYFPSLGKFDLTGDGVEDIYLIPSSQDIPAEADKESQLVGQRDWCITGPGRSTTRNATVYLKKRDQRQYTDHPGLRDLHGAEVLLPADSETRDGPEPPVRTPAFRMGIKSNEKA